MRDRLNPCADRSSSALIEVLQNLGDAGLAPVVAVIPAAIAADRSSADFMLLRHPERDIRYWALRAQATPPSAMGPVVEEVLGVGRRRIRWCGFVECGLQVNDVQSGVV